MTELSSKPSASYMRQYRLRRPGWLAYERALQLRVRYGITPRQYEDMEISQCGTCGICGRAESLVVGRGHSKGDPRRLAVDHDPGTGEVRGLLCGACNQAIGKLGHDPERIRRAADWCT